jgi:inositol transport system ATP-binding protein
MSETIKLRVSKISKSFPGVKALDNIDFAVRKGSVHVLCGENGAGKSTLMKIINGIYQPDSGEIFVDEKPVKIASPIQARHLGISMVFQELNYIPEMTVKESFFIGNLPVNRLLKVNWKEINRRTRELLREENLHYDPNTQMKDLTISDIQMLEITKAVSYSSDIIIMDEPTSAISQAEVERLFWRIMDLRDRGKSIIYISHRLEEIFRIADDITVLRDGCVVVTRPKEELDIDAVISYMVGRKLTNSYPKEEIRRGEKLLSVRNLSRAGVFENVGLELHAGEIVGFAGLMGAGRTEVMRALFGLDAVTSGTVEIRGRPVRIRNVADSIANGMVMLSEDRRRYGLIPIRSILENVSLANLKQFIHGGRLHKKKEYAAVSDICGRIRVKAPSLETTVEALSGGNQQKVVLAKWMVREPDILILDEPTRGIDVGAKYEIYKLMTELAREGKALLIVSSELPELLGMCDRLYVMSKGRVTGELNRDEFSQEIIMKMATGIINRGDAV